MDEIGEEEFGIALFLGILGIIIFYLSGFQIDGLVILVIFVLFGIFLQSK